jgi:hypothetical protein
MIVDIEIKDVKMIDERHFRLKYQESILLR